MKKRQHRLLAVPLLLSSILSTSIGSSAYADSSNDIYFEATGKLDIEVSGFSEEGQFVGQNYQHNTSLAVEPELYWDWNNANDSVVFTPFVRWDEQDDERTHVDIRELLWTHVTDNWEFRTGVGKVFWGVTEFNHLVDVINQTDIVDSFDGEEKLGQPMISASKVTDAGIIDAYLLPGFRERTFPGQNGRLRAGLEIDTRGATYESGNKDQHLDVALRWSHSIGVYDFGVYGFKGTDRTPTFNQVNINGNNYLRPHYQQITQYGLDAQATIDSWLLKLEAIAKSSRNDDYLASQAGFEYTFYGIADTLADLGVLLEYGWDERGRSSTAIAQNDIYLGSRIALNNTDDTAILVGGSYDMDYQSKSLLVEASQRLNDYWTVALDAAVFIAKDSQDNASSFDKDDRVQLTLERYF